MDEKKKTILVADEGISFDINSPGSKSWIKAVHYLEKGFQMEQLKLLVKKFFD